MAVRVFSVEFRSAIAQRILNGERAGFEHGVQDQAKHTLPLARRVSLGGQGWFQEDPGPTAGYSGPVMKTKPGTTAADRRIAELERRIGRLAMENDFLARAFKRVKEARSKNSASGEARCTEK